MGSMMGRHLLAEEMAVRTSIPGTELRRRGRGHGKGKETCEVNQASAAGGARSVRSCQTMHLRPEGGGTGEESWVSQSHHDVIAARDGPLNEFKEASREIW
jgi:hypothetical protein